MDNYSNNMNNYPHKKRRQILRDVLRDGAAGSQDALLRALGRRGVRTVQSTLSRDLREIGAVRVRTASGAFRYEVPAAGASPAAPREKLRTRFRTFVSAVKGTGPLLLVKTSPGNAAGIAALIDALDHPHILGTVAGDDTILVVADGEDKRRAVEKEFHDLL
jgi:transcriptional regulator of arginine metabolism